MTDTANLGLPFIEAGQAQKHVTHNEALRVLDASIQVAVQDVTRNAPPSSPAEGQRHIVAASPTGAWAGRAKAIATWQDGAWAFLVPKNGWCVWSIADAGLLVFDGTLWRDTRGLGFDNLVRLGVNTAASAPNLLSVKSNAALFAAINAADGGSGDVRVQLSKESAAKTASIYFADAYSGRAEFGLVGSDAFKLKVSGDGSSWVEALSIDQTSGTLNIPRGIALSGVIAPPQITANQNDYAPTGLVAASVVQLSTDAARSISGLAGGTDGRTIALINVGAQTLSLLTDNASSSAINRFSLGGDVAIPAKQAVLLRYDGTAARWQALSRPSSGAGGLLAANNLSDLASAAAARANLGLRGKNLLLNGRFKIDQLNLGTAFSAASNGYGPDQWRGLIETGSITMIGQSATLPQMNGVLQSPTANVKFGAFQPIEAINSKGLRGVSVVLSATLAVNDLRIGNVKMGILQWTGTQDAISGNPVLSWGADGVTPTLATNWSFVNAPVNLSVGTAAASYSTTGVIGASMTNLAVLIWSDDKIMNANDFLVVTDVQLELGSVATTYESLSYADELLACQRYVWVSNPAAPKGTGAGTVCGLAIGNSVLSAAARFTVPMRSVPALTLWNNGIQNRMRNSGSGTQVTVSPSGINSSVATSTNYYDTGSPFTTGNGYDFDVIADARL